MTTQNLKAGILSLLVLASLAVAARTPKADRKKLISDHGYWVAVSDQGEKRPVTIHYYNQQHQLLLSEKMAWKRFKPESRKQRLALRRKTDLVAQLANNMKGAAHTGS